jgi:ABC-2 family transporter protein
MTWLTWRQFRAQATAAAAALAAFAILLTATRPHLASLYATSGVVGCHGVGVIGGCWHPATDFLGLLSGIYPVVYVLGIAAVILAPALIGIFWGAPLIAREFETGTFRLAWTQTITRARWLTAKLALVGLAAMAVARGLSLMYGWWAAPIGQAARLTGNSSFPTGMGPFSLLAFDAHGIVPLGYAAFAFALGVTAGALIPRAVPAMAVTLVIFAAVQVAMPLGLRPHLFPPAHTTVTDGTDANFQQPHTDDRGRVVSITVDYLATTPGAWIISSGEINAAGQPVPVPSACQPPPGSSGPSELKPGAPDLIACLASRGIRIAVTYQPTSRYWAIEWTETGIYLAVAVALAGFCYWRVGRRLS